MLKVKVNFTLEQAMKHQRRIEVWVYSFFSLDARGGAWSTPCSSCCILGIDQVPIVQKTGWAQGRSGGVRKI